MLSGISPFSSQVANSNSQLTLLSPTWRGHIEGCATLIRLYGGIHRVLRLSIGKPSPILAIQLILMFVFLAPPNFT